MSIEPGKDLAHYHVLEKIGEGGMGEVWRANDRKLARDVAIKVLPEALAGDSMRLARFEREAQVLASLNHPHIAAIYGLEEIDGVRFLVLELIEGPDLSERLAHGPLPVAEALRIARQIADALEVAHEQGIVHRDLKPANVKLTAAGDVKVLDFGLAKAILDAPGGSNPEMSRSPTITSLATRTGVIMGTAAYMSPEQARGGDVDRRADIWAFGCLVLELLTGGNPFQEQTVSDTLASILRSEPDWKSVPDEAPRALRRLLKRCLEKDARLRLRDIGEARIAIDRILGGETEDDDVVASGSTPAAGASGGPHGWSRRRAIWTTIAAVALTAIAVTAIRESIAPAPPEPEVRRFEVVDGQIQSSSMARPALSPDGRTIAFVRDEYLWVRRLDQLEPQRLEGTEGANLPAWTADSTSIVFIARGDLKSVPVGGGSTTTVVLGVGEVDGADGLGCAPDGRIVFSNGDGGIDEVSPRGGDPRTLLTPDGELEADFHDPSATPDGSLLFVVHRVPQGPDTLAMFVDGARKDLLQLDQQVLADPVYSSTGHIVYHRAGPKAGLWAVPFSLDRHEVSGDPFLVTTDGGFPSVADDGTLLYVRGAAEGLRQLAWVDRDGNAGATIGAAQAGVSAPALSPDGGRVAVMAMEGEVGNIWVYDIERGTRTRLTFGSARDWDPAWTPDGEQIVFWEGATRALSRTAADGSGETFRLMERDLLDSGVPSFASDGTKMVFWVKPTAQEQDIWMVELDENVDGAGDPGPLVASSFIEDTPRISPDDRYVAYASEESGRREIYLTRFPGGDGKWQVSANGGAFPVWSPVGGELFYLEGSVVKQVDVASGPSPRLGTPRTLFDASEAGFDVSGISRYDVSRDGRRFLMVRNIHDRDVELGLVINYAWDAPFRE